MAGTSSVNPDIKLQGVLQKINEQMYERNVELTVRNRTLSVLREIYEIINTTLGVRETAKRLAHTIAKEMGFRGGSILLYNPQSKTLDVIAAESSRAKPLKANAPVLKSLEKLKIRTNVRKNPCVQVFTTSKRVVVHKMSELLTPYVEADKAEAWQTALEVETFVLLPIQFAGKTYGVLILAMDKGVRDLSHAERETLKEVIDAVGIALEQAQTYAALQKANLRLKEVDKMKDDFVSVASHELRTPMTAIKSYLWMALEGKGGKVSKKQAYYLRRAYNSTDRLIKLVNDMLNISRIDSGRISLACTKLNIVDLAREVREEVLPRAAELQLDIRVDASSISHSDQLVVADKEKIKEVFFNLLGNSLKFTPAKGSVAIYFSVDKKNALMQIHVTDTGKGIAEKDMSTLFTKFGMIAGSYATNKKASGTGLGLYISKEIVNLHKGTITAESAGLNEGATFTFTLPLFSREVLKKMQTKVKKTNVDIIHSQV